jgi:hypothetical protein
VVTLSVCEGDADDKVRVEELRTSVVSERNAEEIGGDELQEPHPGWHPFPQ